MTNYVYKDKNGGALAVIASREQGMALATNGEVYVKPDDVAVFLASLILASGVSTGNEG